MKMAPAKSGLENNILVSGPISALGQPFCFQANQRTAFPKCFDWPGHERAVLEFQYL
jgi:hypothetical protein